MLGRSIDGAIPLQCSPYTNNAARIQAIDDEFNTFQLVVVKDTTVSFFRWHGKNDIACNRRKL